MKKNYEHGYKKIENDFKENIIDEYRVFVLSGEEGFLIDNYEKKIKDKYINPVADQIDYIKLDGSLISVDDIIMHCDTLPMMSEKRVVSISNLSLSDSESEAMHKYILSLPVLTTLILTVPEFKKNSKLYKAIAEKGGVYEFNRLDRKDLNGFIKKRIKAEGKYCDEAVCREILNSISYFDRDSDYNLHKLANDLKKIIAYSSGTEITLADVSSTFETSLSHDVFALLDAVTSNNKGDALLLLDNILERGENTFKLLGLLISQYEIMLGYKEYYLRGKKVKEIMKLLNLKSEFRLKKAAGYANKYSVEKLISDLKKLYNVEKNIKDGLYNEKMALTMFIAEI